MSFPGRDELESQLHDLRVRTIDPEGSLELAVTSTAIANVHHRVPVDAHATDRDSMGVHALLHVESGRMIELEFYKDDLSEVMSLPAPEAWAVMVYGE